jgi:DNA primase
MARIPAEEIERLKKDISVRQLAEAHGVELAGQGANLIGCCPFHADRTPSLIISPEKNLWHCLGACQAGGGPIDWVMRANGVSFRHAVELLRADSALAAGVGVPVKLAPPVAQSASDGELLNQVVEFYRRLPPRFAVSQTESTQTQPQRPSRAINKQAKKQLVARARASQNRV